MSLLRWHKFWPLFSIHFDGIVCGRISFQWWKRNTFVDFVGCKTINVCLRYSTSIRVAKHTIQQIDDRPVTEIERERRTDAEKDIGCEHRVCDQVEAEKLFIFCFHHFSSISFFPFFFVSVRSVCVEHAPLLFTATTEVFFLSFEHI